MNHREKNTDQKIEVLLFYSLKLSSRADETVNSVSTYELSRRCLRKEKRSSVPLTEVSHLENEVNTVIRGILESTHNFQPKTPHEL
jgi:hypothetical protein